MNGDRIILGAPDSDGIWLFREEPGHWWRLAQVSQGVVTAIWISGFLTDVNGQWTKPTSEEVSMCIKDESMNRLLVKSDKS